MHTDEQNNTVPALLDSNIDIGETVVIYILRVAEKLIRLGDTKVFNKTLGQAQFNILMILKRHGKFGMSQKDILENLVSTKGNVSIHISNLLKKGYIRSKASQTDKRMHVIKLTAKGRSILKNIEPEYIKELRKLTDDLPRQQYEAAITLLDKLGERCTESLSDSEN